MRYSWLLGLNVMLFPTMALGEPLPDADLDPAEQVAMLCDGGRERLAIRSLGDHDDEDVTYPQRILVRMANFVGLERGQYRTYRTRSYKCGPYDVRFSGDALNSNIQGELGAEPAFLSVAIARGKASILSSTRLLVCESGEGSARWGQCPQSYASRINLDREAGQTIVKVDSDQIAPVPDAELVRTSTCNRVPDTPDAPLSACSR